MPTYEVRNRKTGAVFYRRGKNREGVLLSLGSDESHRDEYDVWLMPKKEKKDVFKFDRVP